MTAPAAVRLLRCLLPWQRRAVSLEVLSILPEFTPGFRTNWSTFCTLCNEAGLRLKALFLTACQTDGLWHWNCPAPEGFPSTIFSELLLHSRLRVTHRCTKSARPLPDVFVEMLETTRAHAKADTGGECCGSVSIKMLVGVLRVDWNRLCQFLSAKGVPAEYPA